MRISRIFTKAPLQPQQRIRLEEKASHHLSKVLRLKVGAELILFNGNGDQYSGIIDAIEKTAVTVHIADCETPTKESPLRIHLGIAASKGDRMDRIMQKATELGVAEISPLFSERSTIKLNKERLGKKHQHWRQILINTCEQCGRNQLPVLNQFQPIENWTNSVSADKKFVLHHRSNQKLASDKAITSAALLIGPEGGLSDREIKQAELLEFTALQLGPRVLRTETAPLAVISVLQYIWGDF
ncbi:MAG: 16S rRNA (uracil(1498)-N(3))-methyltransferase [Pseudomonadales bacterium]